MKRQAELLRWLVVLAMPFFLGFSAIRLFILGADWYLQYEYNKENFPADLQQLSDFEQQQLGLQPLSKSERLELALVAVDYLQRPEPAEEVIYLLEEQRLPGTNRPLYNEGEISHMVDVKHLTDAVARLNRVAAAIVIGGLAVLGLRSTTRREAYRALLQGGIATTLVLLFIGLFIAVAWNTFFVQFHELLFPPGTWSFAYSDALIRFFPEKLWFDFGVTLSTTALAFGLATACLGYLLLRAAARRPS